MPGVLKRWDGTAWVPHVGAPTGRTGPLAVTSYNPGTVEEKTTTSTTLVDADATNLSVTFTAPPSGEVIVVLSADARVDGTASFSSWGIRSGGAVVPGSEALAVFGTSRTRISYRVRLTGLTPGTSYTYLWAHKTSATADASRFYAGGVNGPAVMEVWDAVGTQADGTPPGDAAWTAPTFQNSWANAVGSVAGFRKDSSGYVHMTGKITGGLAATVAFTLPVGYRPGQETDIPVSQWTGSRTLTHVRSNTDGTVVIAAAGDWADLSTVTFLAEG